MVGRNNIYLRSSYLNPYSRKIPPPLALNESSNQESFSVALLCLLVVQSFTPDDPRCHIKVQLSS